MWKNWKTTLIGILGAAAAIAIPAMTTGSVSSKDIATAVTVLGLGAASKDSTNKDAAGTN